MTIDTFPGTLFGSRSNACGFQATLIPTSARAVCEHELSLGVGAPSTRDIRIVPPFGHGLTCSVVLLSAPPYTYEVRRRWNGDAANDGFVLSWV
jgi:hypothetical protein